MVFFTCDACGESLKKNAVEKHYQTRCRNCSVLSCVDCGKDFYGDEYIQHTKCISEEEKYSGKDFKPKPGANKGEAKQELWTNQVQAAINKSKADPKLRNILERLKDYPNIPRKKAKFENFIKNSLGMRDPSIATRTWDLIAEQIAQVKPPPKNVPENNNVAKADDNDESSAKSVENGNSTEEKKLSKRERKEERKRQQNQDEKKDKKKKRHLDSEETSEDSEPKKKKKRKGEEQEIINGEADENMKKSKKKKKKNLEPVVEERSDVEAEEIDNDGDEEEAAPTVKFSWEATIIGCLKKADGKELSLKKLKKKVLAECAARGGDAKSKSEADLIAKFNKKVAKNPRFLCKKDKVKLIS